MAEGERNCFCAFGPILPSMLVLLGECYGHGKWLVLGNAAFCDMLGEAP